MGPQPLVKNYIWLRNTERKRNSLPQGKTCLYGHIELRSQNLWFWTCLSSWLENSSSVMADSTHFSFSESEFQKAKAKSNYSFWRKPPPWNKKWGVKEEQGRKERQTHEGKSLLRTTDGSALFCGSWKNGVFSLQFPDGGKRKFDISLSSLIGRRFISPVLR